MYNSIEQIKVFYTLQTWENNKILRKKSEKVDILMYAYDWVGLAAPQVGKNIRVIATTQWKEIKRWRKTNKEIIGETAMINPEILEHSEEKRKGEEACLSVPWLCGDVERWTRIVVKYQDKKWKIRVQKYTWFSAVVIQHEMDHLEWILFTDKVVGEIREIKDQY